MLEKAPSTGAGQFVIDLEDAVIAAEKDAAREAAAAVLVTEPWSSANVGVRVNAPRSPWCHLDLAAAAAIPAQPRAVVVPKVESAGDVEFVERLLDGLEAAAGRTRPLRIHALIETAAGIGAAANIAASSARLEALVLGYADLAVSLGRSRANTAPLDIWLPAQEAILTAARANELCAIDGPYLGTEVDERFEASARRAASLGFDGKWAIHPRQLAALNEVFSPAPEEVEWARVALAAIVEAEGQGAGSVALNGEMLDEPVRQAAERIMSGRTDHPRP
jgi:citrate lyase subunit beta/citryl-CoA lyase